MIPISDGARVERIFVGVAASLRLKEGVGRGVSSVSDWFTNLTKRQTSHTIYTFVQQR